MGVALEKVLETLRESINYEDWDKVEDAIMQLEDLQEQDILSDGYDSLEESDEE